MIDSRSLYFGMRLVTRTIIALFAVILLSPCRNLLLPYLMVSGVGV